MYRLFVVCCLSLSGCFLYCPFIQNVPPTPLPDGGVAVFDAGDPDGGVMGDAGEDGGSGSDAGTDGGSMACVDPTADGGWDVPNDTFVASSFTLPDCAARGVRYAPQTRCELQAHYFGLWARCAPGDGGVLPSNAPLLELRADSWHLLQPTPDGGLVRRLDLDGSGVLELWGFSPATFRLNVQTNAGGWQTWRTSFEEGPDRLRVFNEPNETIDFGRITVP
jgi:hypothetical protein